MSDTQKELASWRLWLSGEDRIAAAIISLVAIGWAFLIIRLQSPVVLGIMGLLRLDQLPNEAAQNLAATLILFGIMAALAIIWTRLAARPLHGGRPVDIAVGLAAGLVGLSMAFLYAGLGGNAVAQPAPHDVLPLVLGFIAILFQASAEEVYFRGWLQPLLVRHIGPWAGIAVTAVVFGLLHILAGAHTVLSVLNICLAGAFFGLLAWRTGGLFGPMAAHFAWNWAETILFGLSPNPGVDVWGAIWNFDLTGPTLWSGGGEGMNASLAETFVLLALSVPLVLWRSRSVVAPATA